jgi:hypothetical protein
MPSPFPGMDPFIEACNLWRDFHSSLIREIQRALGALLPPNYVARVGQRSYIALVEPAEEAERHFEPDVSFTGLRRQRKSRQKASAPPSALAIADEKPVTLRAFIEEEFTERFIDIFELEPQRRLVTSIEVLSPSNKKRRSVGRRKYLRKRQALLLGRADLVEIDLLRGGERMPMLDPLPASPYYGLVARKETAPACRVWSASFDRPLPTIPVPLSDPDPDVRLALQPLVDGIYASNRYAVDIDYTRPLTPPLTAEQAAWLRRLLHEQTPTPPPTAKRRSRRRT